jgi:hypothetical protein
MDRHDSREQTLARVAAELGSALRTQARTKWAAVRTAERNEHGRHVWRFKLGPDQEERFLHVTHKAMVQGENPTEKLLKQLARSKWLDRLDDGPATALVLSTTGLEPWPRA